ncbi:MAG TPA: glycosyltransferase family 39 protein [Anaerolineae bacterium]|nr:glycosyltransferase family 39 protein [Anaerolineae bacterium]
MVPEPRRRAASGLFLLLLLVVAFALRAYGLNWDHGLFFHPDERQILMVASRLSWPSSLAEFLSLSSPLNPHFFAYGSVPIYLIRGLSALVNLWQKGWADMHRYYLLGRLLSAVFDTLTVLAVWHLVRRLFGRLTAALAAAFLTVSVLHIQLAHFYTADPLLTLLIVLGVNQALNVAQYGRRRDAWGMGLLLALALATKVSVLPLLVVAAVAWCAFAWPVSAVAAPSARWPASFSAREKARALLARLRAAGREFVAGLRTAWARAGRRLLLTFLVAGLGFVLLEPYALLDAAHFVAAIGTEVTMAQGIYDFPYTRQYAGTQPFGYQIGQLLLHGLGPLLGALGVVGLVLWVWRVWHRPTRLEVVALTWPVLYTWMQGWTYAKFMRYMLPLTPFLCISAAALWAHEWRLASGQSSSGRSAPAAMRALLVLGLAAVLGYTGFYALAYLNVYRQPHPWLTATAWLCDRVPRGTVILTEYWDDPLPAQGADRECSARVTVEIIDMHTLDSEKRRDELILALLRADYVALSSQRLYAPLTRQPWFFPLAARYYQALFAGELGFELVAAPAVYPSLAGVTFMDNPREGLDLAAPPLLRSVRPSGLVLDLGYADESFTVYDHPQPLIFAKTAELTRAQFLHLLDPGGK